MSCFFCDCNNHVSQNCSIYASDEERKQILYQKNCCGNCLTAFDENIKFLSYVDNYYENKEGSFSNTVYYPDEFTGQQYCKNCVFNEKCFICFSQDHHTVFCPDRLKALTLFPPNIDRDLLPRFLQCLTAEEKYLLCLSFPDNFRTVKIKPLKVEYQGHISVSKFTNISDCDFFVADMAFIENDCRQYYDWYPKESIGLSILKHIAFRIRHLEIAQSPLYASELLQLLSSKTKLLKCGKVEFLQNLSFWKILRKAPYLEEINICQTNVNINNLWPEYLLQFSQAVNVKDIHLQISTDYDFNVERLAIFMKEKQANISLYIILPEDKHFIQKITNKLSYHFVPYIFSFISLTFYTVDKGYNVIDTIRYELKDV